MIQIKNLTKIFKSKNKEKCIALNDVSFTLPDNGFIFIVGKSGSGKTTLLNMIAGLDKFTKGEINVNGIKLSTLKGKGFDYYRNQTIGFIFQDYQLLDELTVYDNIKLALDFKNDKDDFKVNKALEDVGLAGYGLRYPKELSGGEKQRVAIARALIKDPKIILADEPTGNLDSLTTKQILDILKQIAKTRVVLIVSHNVLDAHSYADYILELSYGKLIGTYVRNKQTGNSFDVDNKTLKLPLHKDIEVDNKIEVLDKINHGVDNIIQDDEDFVPIDLNKNIEIKDQKKIQKDHITFFNSFKRGFSFLKNGLSQMVIFSIITAALFALITVCTSINDMDEVKSISNIYNEYDDDKVSLELNATLDDQFKDNILDSDIDKLIDLGYQGHIYSGYHLGFCHHDEHYSSASPSATFIIDEEYLTSRFGDLTFCAKLDHEEPYGVYICDFLADVENFYHTSTKREYKDMLGDKMFQSSLVKKQEYYINGIIKTDYKEKYPHVAKYLKSIVNSASTAEKSPALKELSKHQKEYNAFVRDAKLYYKNSFSFNTHFVDDFADFFGKVYDLYCCLGDRLYNGKMLPKVPDNVLWFNKASTYGKKNVISNTFYESITGKKISLNDWETKKVDPVTITFRIYRNQNKYQNYDELHSMTVDITFDTVFKNNWENKDDMYFDAESVTKIIKASAQRTYIVLDDTSSLNELYKNGIEKLGFTINLDAQKLLQNISRIEMIFNKIFSMIIGLLLLGCFIILIFYGIYLVKKNIRNIGILKSLGARNQDILINLSINLILTILLTIILFTGFSYLFNYICDFIMIKSFNDAGMIPFYTDVTMLFINYKVFSFSILMIVALSILSFLCLFFYLGKLKPTELVRGNR